MSVAVVGIAGVLLGALLNALGGYVLMRRREKREIRTAARLLLPELLENRSTLDTALVLERWECVSFDTERWQQYETVLAGSMGERWTELTKTYTAFTLLNADRSHREPDAVIDDGDDFEYLLLAKDSADEAIGIVHQLAGVPQGTKLKLQEVFGV